MLCVQTRFQEVPKKGLWSKYNFAIGLFFQLNTMLKQYNSCDIIQNLLLAKKKKDYEPSKEKFEELYFPWTL